MVVIWALGSLMIINSHNRISGSHQMVVNRRINIKLTLCLNVCWGNRSSRSLTGRLTWWEEKKKRLLSVGIKRMSKKKQWSSTLLEYWPYHTKVKLERRKMKGSSCLQTVKGTFCQNLLYSICTLMEIHWHCSTRSMPECWLSTSNYFVTIFRLYNQQWKNCYQWNSGIFYGSYFLSLFFCHVFRLYTDVKFYVIR